MPCNNPIVVLCIYGFLVEMKPSEPYLNEFLTKEKGFTNSETNSLIYPVWTYGQLVMLWILPWCAERSTYRNVLRLESIGFLMTRLLLLYSSSLIAMQGKSCVES